MAIRFENLAPVLTLSAEPGRPRPSHHFVEFYENDDDLGDTVARFLSTGLKTGEAGIVVATPDHREAIQKRLGLENPDGPANPDQVIWIDAEEALSLFMRGDLVDQKVFLSHFGELIRSASGGKPVRIFGEMVALLWEKGNSAAALELEDSWNELAKVEEFRLFCAYPTRPFRGTNLAPLRSVCSRHTHVLADSQATI